MRLLLKDVKMRLSKETKDKVIEYIRQGHTIEGCVSVLKVPRQEIKDEIKKSSIFKKRIAEAKRESKELLADKGIQLIVDYVDGVHGKTDRNRLTAAIALANAFEPGFKGTSRVEGRIDHDVRVITSVPRPKYDIQVEDKEKLKEINAGKPVTSLMIREQ